MRRASQKRLYALFVRKTRSRERAPPRSECIWKRAFDADFPGTPSATESKSATPRDAVVVSSSGCRMPLRTCPVRARACQEALVARDRGVHQPGVRWEGRESLG